MTIKKILVPTDFSECANSAVGIALPMAKRLGAEVLFLHLYPDPVGSLHTPPRESPGLKHTFSEVGHIKAELDAIVRKAENDGIPAKGILVYDKGSETIEEYAESYRVDLIVMGTHGAKGLVKWFGGSNAQHVTRHSEIPVLVIKHPIANPEIRNIVFGSSFNENVMAPMLFLTELAKVWGGTIHLLFVSLAIHSLEKEVAREKMQDIIDKFPDVSFTINFSNTNDEEFAISKTAERLGADLICLTPHDRDGTIRLFSHTIADNLVNHEQRPVLVLPEDDR
jgi:nucleotide-binding universal stress UspA family protein